MSPSSPTGLPTESAPSDQARGGKGVKPRKRPSRPGRRLLNFDRGLGVRFVAGADEAGRGCLAGPLVAAAVLLDLERIGPAQARALGDAQRLKAADAGGPRGAVPGDPRARRRASRSSRGARPGSTPAACTRPTSRRCATRLTRSPCEGCICLSDGFPVAGLGHEQRAVIGGDAKSAAIAAASVLAKETRDRYMRRADAAHPGWEFAQHVGYSTPEHREAIERIGLSPLHRLSFQSIAYQQLALGA